VRFLVDAQLPPGLALLLGDAGHTAEHVNEIGLGAASDDVIWTYACDNNAALVTKDEDFVALSRLPAAAPVIWIRLGNTTNKALWDALEPALAEIVEAISRGEKLIEIV
jgi:predicted nuclease of predicted toxin-antitoxin system